MQGAPLALLLLALAPDGGLREEASGIPGQRRACEAGDLTGCRKLGIGYAEGRGVAPNPAVAARLFRRVCERGDFDGCFDLGRLYYTGQGVPKDPVQAVALFRRACNGKSTAGCVSLGAALVNGGPGVGRDVPRALALFGTSCDAGDPEGCADLGTLYWDGEGLAEDDLRAEELFRTACDGGSASGCRSLHDRGLSEDSAPRATENSETGFVTCHWIVRQLERDWLSNRTPGSRQACDAFEIATISAALLDGGPPLPLPDSEAPPSTFFDEVAGHRVVASLSGPSGSGRFWSVTTAIAAADGGPPSIACIETTTVALRGLDERSNRRLFDERLLPWRPFVDAAAGRELLIYTSLGGWCGGGDVSGACALLEPLVYRIDLDHGAPEWVLDEAATRRQLVRVARVYRTVSRTDPLGSLHLAAARTFEAVGRGSSCQVVDWAWRRGTTK